MMRISILLPYYNKHIAPIYESLAQKDDVEIKIGLLYPIQHFRKGYEWKEELNDDLYLRLWEEDNQSVFKQYSQHADIGISHGLFRKELYAFIQLFLRQNKPVFISTEGLKKSSFLKSLLRRFLLTRINNSNVHLLAIGYLCHLDFYKLGANKWNYYRFAYATKPPAPDAVKTDYTTNGTLKILYVGQLIPRKKVDTLLEALAICSKKGISYSLNIIGDGAERTNLETLAKDRHIASSVTFQGFQDEQSIFSQMKSADVLVLPSAYDGWGAVVNEAMYIGLPILLSDGVRAHSELLKDGENGYLFPQNRPDVLAEKIRLIAQSDSLEKMGETSKRIISHWTPDEISAKLIFLCRNTIKHQKIVNLEGPCATLNF